MIFTSKKVKSKSGVWFAPGKDDVSKEGYFDRKDYRVYKLCGNYDGKVKGGMSYTWRYIARDLSLDEAKKLLESKTK